MESLAWCEISRSALSHNLAVFRQLIGSERLLAPVVKADAYGHGLLVAAEIFVEAGADWLCVHELDSAVKLREAQITVPLLVLGPVHPSAMDAVASTGARIMAYTEETVDAAAAAGRRRGVTIPLHLKVETGNQRQGLELEECVALARRIARADGVSLEGASTHYADIEDTTNHGFARQQRERFEAAIAGLEAAGLRPAMTHASNSAAALLWPGVHSDLVRVGIGCYGLWPSRETYITALMVDRHDVELRPALTWKARIAQVRSVAAGETVGYGRTYRTTHDSRLAVVSVGYWDGYDRRLSNQAHVLVHGQRAPVRGRVCMNLLVVDVSHIAQAQTGDEVILLGASGAERITAEQMAEWIGTIQYEVPTRIHARLARRVVE